MSTDQSAGGPAFPTSCDVRHMETGGMTLRDYFAARAMHALLVADGTVHFENRAREAYQMADAMLRERNSSGESARQVGLGGGSS